MRGNERQERKGGGNGKEGGETDGTTPNTEADHGPGVEAAIC